MYNEKNLYIREKKELKYGLGNSVCAGISGQKIISSSNWNSADVGGKQKEEKELKRKHIWRSSHKKCISAARSFWIENGKVKFQKAGEGCPVIFPPLKTFPSKIFSPLGQFFTKHLSPNFYLKNL